MTRILNYVEFIKKESYNEFITVATAKPHRYTDAKNGTERSLEIAEYVLDTVQDAPATPAIPEKTILQVAAQFVSWPLQYSAVWQ